MFDCRRWVQAVFCFSDGLNSSFHEETSSKVDLIGQEVLEPHSAENALGLVNNFEVDISEGLAFDMFGISPSDDKEVNGCIVLLACQILCNRGNFVSHSSIPHYVI